MAMIEDSMFIVSGVVGFMIICILAVIILTQVNATGMFSVTLFTTAIDAIKAVDGYMILIYIFLVLLGVIGAAQVRVHPAFFFISTIIFVVLIMTAWMLSQAFMDILTDPAIAPYAISFPNTVYFIQHLPVAVLILSFLMSIALYAKPRV